MMIILAFVRENTFLVLNGALKGGNSYKAYIEIPEFLWAYTQSQIGLTKWTLTLLITLSFMFLCIKISNLIFKKGKHTRAIIIMYLLNVVFCLFFYGLSVIISVQYYSIARTLLIGLQSPIVPMLIFIYLIGVENIEFSETN